MGGRGHVERDLTSDFKRVPGDKVDEIERKLEILRQSGVENPQQAEGDGKAVELENLEAPTET